jgi:hypothetical protein
MSQRKLFILLNGRNAENTGFAQVRYTTGTRTVLLAVREYFRLALTDSRRIPDRDGPLAIQVLFLVPQRH